jgi:hypothetical protein
MAKTTNTASTPKVAFVREDMVGDLPAPNMSVGVIGWMRENLFSSPFSTRS